MSFLSRLFSRTPEIPWQPTGVRYTFTGHDESKAEAVYQREQRQAAARRSKAARSQATARQEQIVVQFKAAKEQRGK